MNIEERINAFIELEHKKQLDSWEELLSIGKDFFKNNNQDKELAKKVAKTLLYHRSLMGSSKAYESATEIDVELCEVSTPIARIAFGKSKPLIDYLKSELYYANYRPMRFNKQELEKEINEINSKK